MKYFKLIQGYGAEDYVSITEHELDKAQYCFLEKVDSMFSGGSVRGAEIKAIKEDFHRTMGWTRGYKLGASDYEELSQKGIDYKMRDMLAESKDRVIYLVKAGKPQLIGTKFIVPKPDDKVRGLEAGGIFIDELSEKFKQK